MTTVHKRDDHRVFHKQCLTLCRAGYETHLVVADGLGPGVVEGVNIHDVGESRGRLHRMMASSRKAYRLARSLKAQVYHFHDPELLPVALRLRSPAAAVIYDVHEHTPRQIREKEYIPNRFVRRMIATLADVLERHISARLNAVVAVTDSVGARFADHQVHIVRNVPYIPTDGPRYSVSSLNDRLTLIYPGSLTYRRGILDLVSAMDFLRGEAELILLGSWESADFRRRCEANPGWQYCRYIGKRPHQEIPGVIRSADIGVHMVHDTPNYRGGLPTKVFEYMAQGIPALVSDTADRREFFGDSVYYAPPSNPRALADMLSRIRRDVSGQEVVGRAGHSFVRTQANWESEKATLLSLYSQLRESISKPQLKSE